MTHLSDFSYAERGTQSMFVFGWAVYQLWNADRFASLSPARLIKFNLKTIITYLLLTSLFTMIVYDIIVTSLKYEEGFYDDPTRGIIAQPASRFSDASKTKVEICGQLLNISFTTQSSGLFLLLAFINNFISSTMKMQNVNSNSSRGGRNGGELMSKVENQVVMAYSAISIFAYPILTYLFTDLLSVVMPQVLFHVENIVMAAITYVTNKRMLELQQKFLIGSKKNSAGNEASSVISNIVFYNKCLIVSLLMQAFGLGTINVDILNFKFWGGSPFIYVSKFLTDMCVIIYSLGMSTIAVGPFWILSHAAKTEYNRSKKSAKNASGKDSTQVRPGRLCYKLRKKCTFLILIFV